MTGIRPLDGVAVIDLSMTVAGQYCGRLLAAAGADVLLVEPPDGSPLRRAAPRRPAGGSFLFEHLNQGKGSVVIDPGDPSDSELLVRLASAADVVLRDDASPVADAHRRAVVCTFADFPAGPYEDWHGTEMIHQALGGAMNATGRDDREPIYGVGERAAYATGTTAYIDVLAALEARGDDERGVLISATRYETLAAMGQNLVSQHSFNGSSETRAKYPGYLSTLRCADAWIVLFAIRNWERLCAVFDRSDLADDPRYATQAGRLAGWADITAALQESARDWRADDLVDALQSSRISAASVGSLRTLVEGEQWRRRGVIRGVTDPVDGRRSPALARTFEIDGVDIGVTTPAPSLGDQRGAVTRFGNRPPRQRPAARAASRPADGGPLAGVRVLEFTTAWAGPFAGRCLANLGAEVIKVETASHLDSWRGPLHGGNPAFYPERDPGADAIDRSVLFCSQNIDKRSFGLDLKQPGALDVFDSLVRRADIVLANFKPGVLDRLTGGFHRLHAVNPRISIVEMPAFGPDGPMSDHQGMGKTMEPAAGMTALMAYDESAPVLTGPAFMDPTGGLNGVAAVLTALALRRRTGEGCRIIVPQVEAAAHWIGEYVLQQLDGGTTWEPRGNAAPFGAPHDAFRARGDDAWVAIAVADDDQWSALAAVIGHLELVDDPLFATANGRRRRAGELRTIIERWTGTRTKFEVATVMQAAGVPAAPVLGGAEIAHDEAMWAAGMITELDHPKVGRRRYSDLAFRFDRWEARHRRAAPVFGEANDWVLKTLLDLPDDRVRRLRHSGAVVDHPTAAVVTPIAQGAIT